MTTPFEPFYEKLRSVEGSVDVLCIGELLTDYISKEDKPLAEVTVFDKFLGGSPANIVFHLQNLDAEPVLITKVGKDEDGKFLLDTFQKYEVIDRHIKIGTKGTSKSYIGMRKVEGSETPENIILRGADTELHPEDIDMDIVDDSKIIHTNAFSLAHDPTRSTIINVLKRAKSLGKIISFDPNYRKHYWTDREEALEVLSDIYPLVDITKPSMDDSAALFGDLEPEEYIKRFHLLGADVVVLTMGSDGSMISNQEAVIRLHAEKCDAKDATGAGDLYWAVFLKCLLSGKMLRKCGELASLAASKAVATMGALLGGDEYKEMRSYIEKSSDD